MHRVSSSAVNVAANPPAPVARLHNTTPTPIKCQRENALGKGAEQRR